MAGRRTGSWRKRNSNAGGRSVGIRGQPVYCEAVKGGETLLQGAAPQQTYSEGRGGRGRLPLENRVPRGSGKL